MAFALKSLTAAVASAVFLSTAANAAGLGRLTVLSALGQPLRAEIELTSGSGEDPASMAVKLASPEAFRSANIEFNPALLSLRFAVENRGGRQVIRVTSTQPLNEPFVDMLLELSWNNGRLVREYTFLLDPPELRNTQPAQVAAAPAAQPRAQAPVATPTPAPAQTAPEPATPAPAAAPTPAPARQAAAPAPRAAVSDAPANYRVRRGDTLSGIATRVKPADISLDMMLVALYRANPDAFIGQNMNRLKSGQILSVPDADSVRGGASQGEARGVVVAHAADFDAYRNKLAGQVATSTPAAAAPSGQSASGRVTARVEERPTAANEAQDKLRLSKAESAAAGTPQGGTASVEDTVAKQRELAQAEARVKELEKNVGELENLMTVESRSGAEAQQSAKAPAAETPPPTVPKPAPRIRPAKPEPAPEEPGLADTIIDNFHYIAAGAAVLLLAALGVAQRRKRKTAPIKPVQAEPSVLGASGPNAAAGAGASLFAESGGQSVDTNNSVFNSSFAPSASQLDTNEVDPVAEADVYIAYGRDAQAEEILKEALRTHPERHAVRLKLLEIYAARKDLRAFESQARELHGLTRGQGDEWAQAAALGLGIDPANPLYANAAPAPAPTPSPQERSQQAMLSQQFEDAFRGGAPVAAGAAAGLAAGAAAGTLAHDHDRTAAPQDEPAAPPRTDDNGLDFDLNGLNFEPVTDATPATGRADPDATAVPDLEFSLDKFDTPAPAVQANPAKPADDPNDLDFDMNFDAAPAAPAQPAASLDDEDDFTLDLSPQSQIQATPVDMAGLAKDFEGLPSLPGTPQPTAPSNAAADPLFDLDSMDFGAPTTPVTPAAPLEQPTARPAPAGASEDPLFDLDSMDFGLPSEPKAPEAAPASAAAPKDFGAQQDDPFALFDLPETPAQVPAPQEIEPAAMRDALTGAPVEPSFDLSDFDLDLPPGDAGAQPALAGADAAGAAAQMSPEHMEMETKLDLAIAYQEIGDKEGARELLDEVIKGGSSEQVSKANAMRELLA
ncbi:FimV/HubP family polar landmark protein [Massilia sp.]|uniref:FimV/HubP family polar landmark protein n=1 Tax=Massilia sp. TaxID=1882437 RepID=UPI0028A14ABD|nr:FimV/HubP family polar landmark protein [Massilia sp.]